MKNLIAILISISCVVFLAAPGCSASENLAYDTCINNTMNEPACKDCCDCIDGTDYERKTCRDECRAVDYSANSDFINFTPPSELGRNGDYSACVAMGDERECKKCCDGGGMDLVCGDFRFCRDACNETYGDSKLGGDPGGPNGGGPGGPGGDSNRPPAPQDGQAPPAGGPGGSGGGPGNYSIEQAMSDNAQLSTIAFSGLAFITGSDGADTFFPPGKVADFFGFQYMRDVDTAGYGHNTMFLSRVANNVLYILNDSQKAKLIALAKEQAPLYVKFAYNRFPLMNAFRRNLEGDVPSGSSGLDTGTVIEYTARLYKTDADLSYNRARVIGEIVSSFTDEQKAYLAKMEFDNYNTWPDIQEDQQLKRGMSNNEFVAVMTYASELFSWYKGSLDADVYFCPERHGTYFGGFYMKDYPAMNNPDYFISTAITGDRGREFLNILNSEQRALITGIIDEQRSAMQEIAAIREEVSVELRKAMSGQTIDKAKVYKLIERYGELDGLVSALYAKRFAQVNKTLTTDQRAALVNLRNLTVVPDGAYRFSTPVSMPTIPKTDYMFGTTGIPETAGQTTPPESFGTENASPAPPPRR